jgi:hypothetical protein
MMARRTGHSRRSAGTTLPQDLLRRKGLRGPSEQESADDIAAVDRGERRAVFGYVRGLYGSYPQKFRGYMIHLTPDGLVLRPLLLLSFLWRQVLIQDQFISARVRPFANAREQRKFLSSGKYAPGGRLEHIGTSIISCRTSQGVLEFAVPRPDEPLMLHFIDRQIEKQQYPPPSDIPRG